MRDLVCRVRHGGDNEAELNSERLDASFVVAVEGVFVRAVRDDILIGAEEAVSALLDSLHLRRIDRVACRRDLLNVRKQLVIDRDSARVVGGKLSVERLSRPLLVAFVSVLAQLADEADCRALIDSRLLSFVLSVHKL